MEIMLKTSKLIEITKLNPAISFPDNIFHLLGHPLKNWLHHLLIQQGVSNQPINKSKSVSPQAYIEGPVFIAEDVIVEPFAYIKGPCFIGPGSEIRQGAYIRGDVFVGSRCVVGHTTEVKGSVFLDGAKAGHFAYIGDSVLGRNVNLGAGTKLANLKFNHSIVKFIHPETKELTSSGLKKFGALIGDEAQTGCNSVLDPGTILLPHTAVYPCAHYHGTLYEGIAKGR